MKNKILSIILIMIIIVGLTGCNNDKDKVDDTKNTKEQIEEKKDSSSEKSLKEFLNNINNKNFDSATNLIDKEKMNEIFKMNLPNEEFSKALEHALNDGYNSIKYDVNSLKIVKKDEVNDIISSTDDETKKNNQQKIIDLFDGYDLYVVDYQMSYKEETTNLKDILFIKDDNSSFGGSILVDGLFSYYYNAVYNKPTR